MRNDSVIVLDMDGVVVDTVPALRAAYAAFAHAHDFVPTAEEFDQLNGPKLSEIVRYLKSVHAISVSESVLFERYEAFVQEAYSSTSLVPGVRGLIDTLRAAGVTLALATSAGRGRVVEVLQRHGLTEAFAFVVTGDEVECAKPDPEIYRRVAAHFPHTDTFYVIEDSMHGATAAATAGMKALLYDPTGSVDHAQAIGRVSSMRSARDFVLAELVGCQLLATCSRVDIRLGSEGLAISDAEEQRVVAHWNAQRASNPRLFDGLTLSYQRHELHDDQLVIACSAIPYRYVVAAHDHPEWNLPVSPLGVSGVAFDGAGRVLLARRHGVTDHEGSWELVPSGGISPQNVEDGTGASERQVREEWGEETRLPTSVIQAIRPFALVRDRRTQVHDICCRIELSSEARFDEDVLGTEYVEPLMLTPAEMRAEVRKRDLPLVPVSWWLLHRSEG